MPGPTIADIARAAEVSPRGGPALRSLRDAVCAPCDPGGGQVRAAVARHGIRIPADLLPVRASEDPA
ncbi:hypothetical protein [Streptomyces sp. NPDC002467]